ncbi:MAG: histidine kinase dimerization/phospho-acceptor domain-containing protein, partial [Chthoniobacterales bacterium]
MKNNRLHNLENDCFSRRLEQLMRGKHLKPAALAREIGISHVAVKNYLEGRIPDTKLLYQLARFFGVSMEYLLTGTVTVDAAKDSVPGISDLLDKEGVSSLKGSLVSVMNYEFRAPLNGILGFTDLLSESALSKEQKEHVSMIRESGDILLKKLNDLLEIASADSGEGVANTEGSAATQVPASTRRALIVEDDPTSRKLLLRMLKNFGIEADYAANGHACL